VTCWNSSVEVGFQRPTRGHATMKKDTVVPLHQPEGQDLLSAMLREGAQRLIERCRPSSTSFFVSLPSAGMIEGVYSSKARSGAASMTCQGVNDVFVGPAEAC